VDDFDALIEELRAQPSPAVGELFIFVDECHRTQSGKLHKTMKALLPGAVFFGFTGTPLLKQDKATSQEVFGSYIHTYKFGEAVEDGVVLDLLYEARDIPQELASTTKIDQWFEAKTKGLNDWQKAALREQWGTMQKVLSSRSRMERVVEDIVFDFGVKPRLVSHRGNAMLVASSIYEACRYFELFEKTVFKARSAIITSYNPNAQDVTKEDTGANTETEKQFIYNLYTALLKDVVPRPGKSKTETYEDAAKEKFIKQPANMRLLIVVDKLLTGFDAPSCTYLYIDKSMQDHGLFQAICRTNRLDGDDKPFGYIVDYKDLFKKVQGAIAVYTSELEHEVERAVALRDTIRQASGETLDLKAYEADMRHLIDTYIKADGARAISDFDGIGLLDLIVKIGIAAAVNGLPPGIRKDKGAVAETIANNVRSKIIKEKLNDPAFYESMSALLKDVLADLRANRISYEEFLQRIADLATKVQSGKADTTPKALDTPGKRALFNNLGQDETLALRIDAEVKRMRPDGFRGNQAKENIIKRALLPLLGGDAAEVERIFAIIKAQPEY
jgi:hypothetical protein